MRKVHLLGLAVLVTGVCGNSVFARGDTDRRAQLLEQFDTDGDGTLSDAERQAAREARRAELLEKYDADDDGTLSDAERAAAVEAGDLPRHRDRRHHRHGRFGGRLLGPCPAEFLAAHDTDGDGTLSDAERQVAREARKAEFLGKYDADDDGTLSDEEREAAHAGRQAEVLEKYDTDDDGTLSDAEREAAREARKAECAKAAGESAALTAPQTFVRGDANEDGTVDVSDPIAILAYLFIGTVTLNCLDAADANDDGHVDVSDPTAILSTVFLGLGVLPEPSTPAADPTPDNLSCGG